jgi:hypothetical protein
MQKLQLWPLQTSMFRRSRQEKSLSLVTVPQQIWEDHRDLRGIVFFENMKKVKDRARQDKIRLFDLTDRQILTLAHLCGIFLATVMEPCNSH